MDEQLNTKRKVQTPKCKKTNHRYTQDEFYFGDTFRKLDKSTDRKKTEAKIPDSPDFTGYQEQFANQSEMKGDLKLREVYIESLPDTLDFDLKLFND